MTTLMPIRPLNPTESDPPPGKNQEREVGDEVIDGEDDEMPDVFMPYSESEAEDRKPDEREKETDGLDDLFADAPKADQKASDEENFECGTCNEERPAKTLRSPMKPTAEAVEAHYATHLPYRNWCPVCVRAKGVEDPHQRGRDKEVEDNALPIVSMDYNSIDGQAKCTNEAECKVKTLVLKDEKTGSVFQHVTTVKGPGDDWLMRRICKDVEELGHADIILKSDGEPAIVAVQVDVQSKRKGKTLLRNPPAYDPKANGSAEKAVRDTTEQARALKLGLEERLKTSVPVGASIVEWILEHAAFIISKYCVGHDGMTPHERLTGRKWHRPAVEIGEVVWAKLIGKKKYKGKKEKKKQKLAEQSVEAIWVGQSARTGEHYVVQPGGDAFRCRTVRRVPMQDRWSSEKILQIEATPRRPTPTRAGKESIDPRAADDNARREAPRRGSARPQPRDGEPAEESGERLDHPEGREPLVRDFRITTQLLEKYGGFWSGCQGCECKAAGLAHRNHSIECRRRLQEKMQESEEGRATLEEASRRKGAFQAPPSPRADPPAQSGPEPAVAPAPLPHSEAEPDPKDGTAQPDCGQQGGAFLSRPPNEDDDDDDDEMDGDDIGELNEENVLRSGDASKRPRQEGPKPSGKGDDAKPDAMGVPSDGDKEDEPNAKRSRLGALTIIESESGKMIVASNVQGNEPIRPSPKHRPLLTRAEPKTMVGKALCKIDEYPKIAERVDEANVEGMLKALREHTEVKAILEELEKGIKAKTTAKNRESMRNEGSADVAEIYSPPRMTRAAEKMGLRPGWSLDLTQVDQEDGQPWDFSVPAKRAKAKEMVTKDKPFLLVLCPMCGPFSTAANFSYVNQSREDVKAKLQQATEHVRFAVELCIMQCNAGRLFVFEHPVGASTWETRLMKDLHAKEGVYKVNFDFCTAGMAVGSKRNAEDRPHPVKKRTSLITNSSAIHIIFKEAQCRGDHVHAEILSGKTAECQQYPEKFCKMICESVKRELSTIKWRNRLCQEFDITGTMQKLLEMHDKVETATVPPEEDHFTSLYDDVDFVDDITGAPLRKNLAIEARKKEIEYFRRLGVYTKVKKEKWMKIISTKWIDQNKGDEMDPNYRARLVAREINRCVRNDLFAATPPLESLRLILSRCAAHQYADRGEDNFVIMYNDVKRAYFHAPAQRPIYVKIPMEDFEPGDEDMVGMLNLFLYGTRDAAKNWAAKYTEVLLAAGFKAGLASPCNFFHEKRGISVTVHGDDFTSTGTPRDLKWFEMKLKEEFELVTEVLGPGRDQRQQVRILNRVISWGPDGISYEADQRHAEIIISELGLEGAKPLSTPGSREDAAKAGPPTLSRTSTATATTCHQGDGKHAVTTLKFEGGFDDAEAAWERHGAAQGAAEELLSPSEARAFRGLAARLNYLAQDRPDVQYAAKEVSRRMARPSRGDWSILKRAGRYLVGAPRAVQLFAWQAPQNLLEAFVDSDWAGCASTCRSTSGGVLRLGAHVLRTWSTTQATVAKSSAEAELFSLTKGAATALGMISTAHDLGMRVDAKIHSDASAAIAIAQRQGLGELRHLKVQFLWIQERIRRGDLAVQKVPGKDNPADLLTKHLSVQDMQRHLKTLDVAISKTRAAAAPKLSMVKADGRWLAGQAGELSVMHETPRRTLVTPPRIQGAPPVRGLTAYRLTEGVFCDTGEEFTRRDNWTSRASAHADLGRRWTGSTTFVTRDSMCS